MKNSPLAFIFVSLGICLFEYVIRLGLDDISNSFHVAAFFSLAVVLILLPEWLFSINLFQLNIGTLNALTLVFVCFLGFTLGNFPYFSQLLYFSAFLLLLFQIKRTAFGLLIRQLPFFILFAFAFTLLFFNNEDAQSPLAFESLILGEIHVDNVFHVAILNMIDTYGLPSVGTNGIPYLNYHWFSHFILLGFKTLLNIHALGVYNYVYPIVFIPFFLKVLYDFFIQIKVRFYQVEEQNNTIIYFIFTLASFISVGLFHAFWLIGESNVIATILALGMISFLLLLDNINSAKVYGVILISFFWLLIISATKISIGLPLGIGALFFLVLKCKDSKQRAFAIILFLIYFLIVFKLFAPRSQGAFEGVITNKPLQLLKNIVLSNNLMWKFSNGFLHYTLGFVLAVVGLYRGTLFFKKEEGLSQDNNLLFYSLAFLNLVSLAFAFYSTGLMGSMNAWYFMFFQMVIGILLLIVLIEILIAKLVHHRFLNSYLFLAVLVFFFSTKGFLSFGSGEYRDIKFYTNLKQKYLNTETLQKTKMLNFVTQTVNFKANSYTIVFADSSQKWLLESQTFRPHAQAFLLQSITGMAGIATLSPQQYSNFSLEGYFFKNYRLGVKDPFPNLEKAREIAKSKGFKSLLHVYSKNDTVVILTYDLNN